MTSITTDGARSPSASGHDSVTFAGLQSWPTLSANNSSTWEIVTSGLATILTPRGVRKSEPARSPNENYLPPLATMQDRQAIHNGSVAARRTPRPLASTAPPSDDTTLTPLP